MQKEALLQIGLTEEQADKILGLFAESILKSYVPKEKLEEAEKENIRLTTSLKERDTQLEGLKATAGLSEELQKKLDAAIAKNQKDSEQAAAEFAAYKKDNSINLYLLKIGAKNAKAVKALLDLDKVSVDGENLIGIKEQLDALKISDAYLFEPIMSGREPSGGGSSYENEPKDNPFKKETWNLTKQGQLFKENPELYKKLKAAAGL